MNCVISPQYANNEFVMRQQNFDNIAFISGQASQCTCILIGPIRRMLNGTIQTLTNDDSWNIFNMLNRLSAVVIIVKLY